MQVTFLNIHTGFNGDFRFCLPLAKHGKFAALVFMNQQIQKGKISQQIRVTASSVRAVPLHLSVSQLPSWHTGGCTANLGVFPHS